MRRRTLLVILALFLLAGCDNLLGGDGLRADLHTDRGAYALGEELTYTLTNRNPVKVSVDNCSPYVELKIDGKWDLRGDPFGYGCALISRRIELGPGESRTVTGPVTSEAYEKVPGTYRLVASVAHDGESRLVRSEPFTVTD